MAREAKLSLDMQPKSRSAVSGTGRHNERVEGQKHSNPDIDDSRTHLNYNFVDKQDLTLLERTDKRIAEGRNGENSNRKIQKNAVLLQSHVITINEEYFKDIGPEETKRFFKTAFDHYCEKFGKENIMSAEVHMDEKVPHLHILRVPLEQGKLVGGVFRKKEMFALHTDAHNYLKDKGFDIQRGETSEIKKDRVDLATHKAREFAKLERTLSLKGEDLTSLQADLEARGAELEKSKASITAEIAENNKFLEQVQNLKVTREQINDIDRRSKLKEKTLGMFGERRVETTFEDFCTLVHTAKVSAEAVALVEPLKEKNAELTEINSKNQDLSKSIDVLNKEKSHYTKENAELRKAVDGIAKELYFTHRSAGLNDKSCAALMLKSTEISRNVVINTIAKHSPQADKMSDKANAYAKEVVKSAENILDGGKTKSKGGGMAGRGGSSGGGREKSRSIDLDQSRPMGPGLTINREKDEEDQIRDLIAKGIDEDMAREMVGGED